MIPILYESTETDFTSNGLGRLRDCISFNVTEERNGVYEADFEYPVGGAHYEDIKLGRIVCVTHDDSGDIQPFDIVSCSKSIEGVVAFHAVHISYRQNYLTCYGSNINSISEAFQLFATAQPENPFSYDADFSSNAFMASADTTPRSVKQMIGGVEGSFLDAYGGEILWDRFNVHFLKQRGIARDFTIRYGVNMLDYNDDTDYSGSYLSCIPFWHGQDSTGNEITVIGSRVDYGGTSYNGRNDCVPLDLTEKFESQPTSAQLETMAQSVMATKQPNLPSQNIKVDFIRLQDMSGYEQFDSLLQCNLCDTINVVFPEYDMQGSFKIVRTVYDSLSDRYTEMELGALSTSLAEALGISNTPNPERINENYYVDSNGNVTTNGDIDAQGDVRVGGSLTVSEDINGIDISKVLARGDFTTVKHTTQSVSVGANTTAAEQTETFTKSGYYPYAIAGYCFHGSNLMYQNLFELFMSSRGDGTVTVTYRFRNTANASVSISLDIYILWIRVL